MIAKHKIFRYPSKHYPCVLTGLLYVLLMAPIFNLSAQQITTNGLRNDIQYGMSTKLQVILNDNRKKNEVKHLPTIRLCLNLGSGVLINLGNQGYSMLPAYHAEVLLYYQGIGSNSKRKGNIDINSSFTTTLGKVGSTKEIDVARLRQYNSPLYFFSNHATPPLLNPFDGSITFGFNYIIPTTKYKFSQRLGYFGFKAGPVQFGYFNDGGKGLNLIGDRKDRNYTGGLLLAYGFQRNTFLDQLELTYLKYTGYNTNTFEVLSNLSFGYNDYLDPDQEDYNRSKWSLHVQGLDNRFSAHLDANNMTKLDLQHLIHKLVFDPYHIVKRLPSVGVGVSIHHQLQRYIQ
jgi:hypothetical protein